MNEPVSRLASRNRRSITEAAMAGAGAARGPHISIRGGRFHLVTGAGLETHVDTHYLDLVVVDANANTSKIFFAYDYDPNNDQPPDCFSDNGTGPSLQSMTPQAPTCAVCPWNARGSDTTFSGKPTKACQDRKKLAVIVDGDPTITVYEFQVPPGSRTNLNKYTQWLSEQPSPVPGRKLDLADVVTRVEFDPDKQFTMKFSAVQLADDERTMQVIDYIDANKLSDVAVGRADVAWEPELLKGRLAQRLAAPANAPANPGFTIPPQPQAPALAPPAAGTPQAPPAPPAGRRPRGRPPATAPQAPAAPAAPSPSAPFMAAAAPASAPPAPLPAPVATAALAPVAPPADDLAIPDFLRRQQEPTAPAPAPRGGIVQNPPAAPTGVAAALSAAVGLASRR